MLKWAPQRLNRWSLSALVIGKSSRLHVFLAISVRINQMLPCLKLTLTPILHRRVLYFLNWDYPDKMQFSLESCLKLFVFWFLVCSEQLLRLPLTAFARILSTKILSQVNKCINTIRLSFCILMCMCAVTTTSTICHWAKWSMGMLFRFVKHPIDLAFNLWHIFK